MMQIEIICLPRATLAEFAEANELIMSIKERRPENQQSGLHAYYASFKGCETLSGSVLCGDYGNGSTPDQAMSDYAKQISGKRLVVDAYTAGRKEILVPILTHINVFPVLPCTKP